MICVLSSIAITYPTALSKADNSAVVLTEPSALYVFFQPVKLVELKFSLAGMLMPSTSNNLTLIVSEITNDFNISLRLSITDLIFNESVEILSIVVASVIFNT